MIELRLRFVAAGGAEVNLAELVCVLVHVGMHLLPGDKLDAGKDRAGDD